MFECFALPFDCFDERAGEHFRLSFKRKKENLSASNRLFAFVLFKKDIFRCSCLSTRKNVGARNRFVASPRRFVRPDAKPVENSSTPAGCQKTSGEAQAISGPASRRRVAFHRSSVPSNRSSVERNETSVRSYASSVPSPDVSWTSPRRAGTFPRSPGETNETCVEETELLRSIPQTFVPSNRSSVERNETSVRLYGCLVGENECSVAPTNLSGRMRLFV